MKKLISAVLTVVLLLNLVACNGGTGTKDDDGMTREVTLYFANNAYIVTGDESLEKLIAEQRVIEETTDGIGMNIFEALKKGSENPDLATVINERIQVREVKFVDETAYVDFDKEGLNGSSLEEHFTIAQIVASLLALEEVQAVQLLIDGEVADSLMGHETIEAPFVTVPE